MLIVADPHFGKASNFRNSGIAIPEGTTDDDLKRLDWALKAVKARTLLILGDLMHAAVADDSRLHSKFSRWRRSWSKLGIILISGNHDRRAGPPPPELSIQKRVDYLIRSPFGFAHYPQHLAGAYAICGHLHPAVHLQGAGRQSEYLPCYYFGRDYAVLPAFGGFTGNSTVLPRANERVFVVADGQVVECR